MLLVWLLLSRLSDLSPTETRYRDIGENRLPVNFYKMEKYIPSMPSTVCMKPGQTDIAKIQMEKLENIIITIITRVGDTTKLLCEKKYRENERKKC